MSKFLSQLRMWGVVVGLPFLAACAGVDTLPFLGGGATSQLAPAQTVGDTTFIAPSGLCFDSAQTRKGFGKAYLVAKRCKATNDGHLLTYTIFTQNAPQDISGGALHPKTARLVSDEVRNGKRFVVYDAQQSRDKNLHRNTVRGARAMQDIAVLVTHYNGTSSTLSVSQRTSIVDAGLSQITGPGVTISAAVAPSEPMLRPKLRPTSGG